MRWSKKENEEQGGEISGGKAHATQDEDILPHHRQTAAARLPTGERCLLNDHISWEVLMPAPHVLFHDHFLLIRFGAVHSFALQMRGERAERHDAAM